MLLLRPGKAEVVTFLELLESGAEAFKEWVLEGYEPSGPTEFAVSAATDVDVTGRVADSALVWDGTKHTYVKTIARSAVMVVVTHGSDPDVARPAGVGGVLWVGSVQPANWQAPDLWNDTEGV